MKLAVAVLSVATLTGCCLKKPDPVVKVVKVEVPVPVPCPPAPKTVRPTSVAAQLPKDATPDQRAKALVLDLAAWIAYAIEQERLLDAYRPTPQVREPSK